MNRQDLEHLIRAAGAIAESAELVVIGSQAILGTWPEPPAELLISQEADLYPRDAPQKADLIDGSIGEMSPFHEQFGYYAHGVGPETAILPAGWQNRLVALSNPNTGGVTGFCLHPVDIAVSKLAAGRARDLSFVRGLLEHGLVSEKDIRAALPGLDAAAAERVSSGLAALASG